MLDPRSIALNLIFRNPSVANNPQAQNLISVIQNGDSKKGEEIARNLCNTYGVTPEQAFTQAKNFFGFPN